ncbi:MAG TPA: ComF family protein [Candidatus Binatia bacterium]|jgi:ComF family protein
MRAENSSFIPQPSSFNFGRWLDWLYPPRCRFCGDSLFGRNDCFCRGCRERIRVIGHPFCTACGRPFLDTSGDDHLCGNCIARRPHFVRARAWACYPTDGGDDHPLREVVQRFKYGRKVSLGKPLGRLMAIGCRDLFHDYDLDVIIPVPLHAKRLRWRGFNQSVILAREIGRHWKLPVDPCVLVRSRETPPQTQLHEDERRKNMRRAFSVNPAKSIDGKAALLIDDVYTSGATVNECSRALVRAGVREVYVLTLARTV